VFFFAIVVIVNVLAHLWVVLLAVIVIGLFVLIFKK
jgi:hypothetical protein